MLTAPAQLDAELRLLVDEASAAIGRLQRDLDVEPAAPFVICLLPRAGWQREPNESDPLLVSISELEARAPPWAAGYLVPELRLGAIRQDRVHRYPYRDSLSVLLHEVVHMLTYDAAGDAVPRWFGEGLATISGHRWGLRDAVVQTPVVLLQGPQSLAAIDRAFSGGASEARAAYALSIDFLAWAERRYGRRFFADVLASVRELGFEEAWRRAAGVTVRESERRWQRRNTFVYRWLPVLGSSGTLWLLISTLALVAAARKRRQVQEIRRRWLQAEEHAERRDHDDPWIN